MPLPSIPHPRTSILITFGASVMLGLIVILAARYRPVSDPRAPASQSMEESQ